MKRITNNLVLEIHIPDFEKARQFYAIFGFKQTYYEPVSEKKGTPGYMVLKREDKIGDTLINFYGGNESVSKHIHFNRFPSNTPRGYGVEITIPVSDVNKLWGLINKKLAATHISEPLRKKSWGKKDFRVIDPFGFYVRFTELVDWEGTNKA